jgi:hypothetical protein
VIDLTVPADRKGKHMTGGGSRGGGRGGGGKEARPDALGVALHSVYDATVAEDIPPEMLDLLGKLG